MQREGRTTSVSDLVSHFNDIVQVLRLPDLDGRFARGIDSFQRSHIGAAFVERHRLGFAILGDRFFEIPPRRSLIPMGTQQKVDGVAALVDGAIQVFPWPLTLM